MTNVGARCNKLTGSFSAGYLLYRVCYWMPRATRNIGGHLWIAKTHEQWAEDVGGTVSQVKRALVILREKGLVITEKHKFNGDTVGFLRLTNEAEKLLELSENTPLGQHDKELSGQYDFIPSIDHHQIHTPEEHHLLLTEKMMFDACAHATPHSGGSDIPDNGENMPTLSEVLSVKKPVSLNKKHETLEPLGSLWKRVMSEEYGSQVYVGPWTVKELAQLKRLEKLLVPDARRVLEAALRDWGTFAATAKTQNGLKDVPGVPNVGFILKFYSVAVALWANKGFKATKQHAPAPKESAPVQLTATQPLPPAGPPKLSKQEVFDILGEDGDET